MSQQAFYYLIEVGERTKKIEHLSRQITLEAINAGLSARMAGEQGKGFTVVAHELRNFSDLLNQFKGKQIAINHTTILLSTERMFLDLRIKQLRKVRQTEQSEPIIQQLLTTRNSLDQKIKRQEIELKFLVDHMKRYCKMGGAIAKNGLIEAAHAGKTGSGLQKVAEIMGNAVAEIYEHLASIHTLELVQQNTDWSAET